MNDPVRVGELLPGVLAEVVDRPATAMSGWLSRSRRPAARRLPSMLRQLPAVLGPERVANLVDQAQIRFHAAA